MTSVNEDEHLPECIYERVDESRPGWRYCICSRLIDREQRVLDEVLPDVRYAAYEAGVQAAHGAVTELLDDEDIKCCTDHTMPVRQALTAIDGLREKKL